MSQSRLNCNSMATEKRGLRETSSGIRQQYPYWAKDPSIGLRTINAKAETITTAPAFREAIKYRRCLVPADAFYEWQKLDAKTKRPFAIALKSREPYVRVRRALGEMEGSESWHGTIDLYRDHD
jgi:putative SOS response-associated peptidase YedK